MNRLRPTGRGLTAASLLGLLMVTPSVAQDPCAGLRFTDVAEQVGLRFLHDRGSKGEMHLPETMGAGAAWFDYDGDGWLDLYVVQSGPFPPDGSEAAANRLYRGRGDGTFEEVRDSGAEDRGCGQGVAVGDVNGDGRPDLFVTNYGEDRLLIQQPDGTYRRGPFPPQDGWSSSAAFADADGDGDLDLYVSRYMDYELKSDMFCGDPETGRREYCDPSLFLPSPDSFYRNRGDGTFEDATLTAGFETAIGRGLGVVFTDLDDDGRPDVYVANDLNINHLFHNLGEGRFEALSLISGAGLNRQGKAEAGMGVAVGDIDGDLDPDLVVTNFDVETNTLYRNLGGMVFEDMSAASGFAVPSFNLLGFGDVLADLDLDGDLDAYITNGHIYENPARETIRYRQPDLLLLGDGRGGFRTAKCGPVFESREVGRGLAAGDYDNDGDIDLVIVNNAGPLQLLRNDVSGRRWVGVRLRGKPPNGDAVGARVLLVTERGRQVRWVMAGDSYQSASDRRLLFGLAAGDRPLRVEVTWPWGQGETRAFVDPPLGDYVTIDQATGELTAGTAPAAPLSDHPAEPCPLICAGLPPWLATVGLVLLLAAGALAYRWSRGARRA